MYNISVEMPSGARSRGYDRKDEDVAVAVHDSIVKQLTILKLTGSVVTVRFADEIYQRTEIV